MTKEKLLMLYNKLQNGEITARKISALRNFTDEDIDIILSSKDEIVAKRLLSSHLFKKLPKGTQQEIIEIIDNCKNYDNKWEAIEVATNKISIESGHIVELVKIIIEANKWSLKKASAIARNYNSVTSGHIVELTSIVAQCKELDSDHFVYIGVAAEDEIITRSGKVVDVVKKIIAAENKKEAHNIWHRVYREIFSTHIGLLDALSKGNLTEVNFWDLFNEDSDRAMIMLEEESLLLTGTPYETQILETVEIGTINPEQRLLRANPDNEILYSQEEKMVRNNPEILPYARIRRKK